MEFIVLIVIFALVILIIKSVFFKKKKQAGSIKVVKTNKNRTVLKDTKFGK